jgi:hypothetical protein
MLNLFSDLLLFIFGDNFSDLQSVQWKQQHLLAPKPVGLLDTTVWNNLLQNFPN